MTSRHTNLFQLLPQCSSTILRFGPVMYIYIYTHRTTRKHSIPISNSRRRLVMPSSECRWVAVLECKVPVCKMNLLTLWPWPLNPKTLSLLGYPKVIHYTKFEHFGIIRFWVMPRKNKQTDKQTDSNVLLTPTDIVGNNCHLLHG